MGQGGEPETQRTAFRPERLGLSQPGSFLLRCCRDRERCGKSVYKGWVQDIRHYSYSAKPATGITGMTDSAVSDFTEPRPQAESARSPARCTPRRHAR